MRLSMNFGLDSVEYEVAENRLIAFPQPPAALDDPAAAVRAALEEPFAFPPLRQALTPEDHVAIVVDETLPLLAELLVPVLEHVRSAGIEPQAMTLLTAPSSAPQTWIEQLPDEFQEVRVERADLEDRRRLAYLATTKQGKRLYLNRTLVEAEQIVVLSSRHYDSLHGYGGAEGALFPAFSDWDTRREMNQYTNRNAPDATPWPARRLATETAWLLGAPFFVQVIEAAGDAVARVMAGTAEASKEGQRLLDLNWRHTVSLPADLVVAGVSGDPARHSFATLCDALSCAARVVREDGRIVLLTQANPAVDAEAQLLREAEESEAVSKKLTRKLTYDPAPILRWTQAVRKADVYLLSGLTDDTVEDVQAIPLHQAREVRRLLDAADSCLFLPDAHKMLALLE